MPPIDAATLGALIHAAAGDAHRGTNGLLAGELARYISLISLAPLADGDSG
jgi:NAD(P)H-hydrate repair Nnr-like enzyme with NAD(P)H-hydrate dehydratase domain